MLNEVRELGFEYAELGHGTRLSLLDGALAAVAAAVRIKISSLHNFCPLPLGVMGSAPDYYLPSSRDENERQCAVRHTMRTIDTAAALGAKMVVLHLGSWMPMRDYTMRLIGMYAEEGAVRRRSFRRLREKAAAVRDKKRRKHLEQVYRTLDEVLPRAKEMKVMLGMETRFGIEEIPSETEADEILKRFGTESIMRTGMTWGVMQR